MLIEKAKSLIPVIDELVNIFDNGKILNSEYIWDIVKKTEYEDILILQSIMYIGQNEHKPDPKDYSNYNAYEAELERYQPERMLKDYVRMFRSDNDSGFNRLYSMLAKMPLLDYLQDGLDLLRIRHVIEKRDTRAVN
ncbi:MULTISPECIES: hypothetical protein [Paenibacillus]|uniref:Uncharacterized protein n=1 Tax=Paenibacillus lautus TaxID=1401 RepID=A0A1R1AKQ1_PAELA|nr:hypothetical protein [Paenibacillus lautus]OME85998.1 hypothetical protein BK123_33265 [Paenibacillus lautus]